MTREMDLQEARDISQRRVPKDCDDVDKRVI